MTRLSARSTGRWLVTDTYGARYVWDMDACTWECLSGGNGARGPWRIMRAANYPTVGAISEVMVDDPSREWTMPSLVIHTGNVTRIERL